VNLLPDESRTAPIAVEELEQWGVALSGKLPTFGGAGRQTAAFADPGAGKPQKLWRWIIAGVLGLLAVETALAGRLARRATMQAAEPQVNDNDQRAKAA
jgi:hypothetical protein